VNIDFIRARKIPKRANVEISARLRLDKPPSGTSEQCNFSNGRRDFVVM
jgi:hypothetical protein